MARGKHYPLPPPFFSLPVHLMLRWSEQDVDLARGCVANSTLMGPRRFFLLLPEAARRESGEEAAGLVQSPTCPMCHASGAGEKGSCHTASHLGLLTLRDMARQPPEHLSALAAVKIHSY